MALSKRRTKLESHENQGDSAIGEVVLLHYGTARLWHSWRTCAVLAAARINGRLPRERGSLARICRPKILAGCREFDLPELLVELFRGSDSYRDKSRFFSSTETVAIAKSVLSRKGPMIFWTSPPHSLSVKSSF